MRSRINSISAIPFIAISDAASSFFKTASFSRFVPFSIMIGCKRAIAPSDNSLERNSSFTLSRPILSSLSIATVISTILSASPIISAMPERILRLFILIQTRIPKRRNTSSIIWISSTSFTNESEPTTSPSHW